MNRNEKILEYLKAWAHRVYTDKPIVLQLMPVFFVFTLATIVFQVLSGITEYTAMYYNFGAEHSNAALVVAILLLITIELTKRVVGAIFFVKWISGNIKYIGVILVLFLASQGASVYLSLDGSTKIPKTLQEEPEKVAANLIDIDSIHAYWDANIQEQDTIAKRYEKAHSKFDAKLGHKRISHSGTKTHNEMTSNAQRMRKDKQIALDAAIAENKLILKQHNADHEETVSEHLMLIASYGSIMWYWSLGLEIAFFFFSWFIFWYLGQVFDYGTETETANNSRTSSVNTNSVHLSGTGTEQMVMVKQKPIGFNNNKRTCIVCSTDISDKRADAKVCSAKCRKIKNQC